MKSASQLITVVLLTGPLCSFGQQVPGGEFLISGKLTQAPDGTTIHLSKTDGNLRFRTHTDTLKQGEFTFRDTVTIPRIVRIGIERSSGSLEVWVAPGERIDITGNDRTAKSWSVESKIPQQIEENGYQALVKEDAVESARLYDQYNELIYAMFGDRKDDAEFAARAKVECDSLLHSAELLDESIAEKTLRYMEHAPTSPIWMGKLLTYAQSLQYGAHTSLKAKMQELYNRLPADMQCTEDGKLIYNYLNPAPTVGAGDQMVDGDLYDMDGNLRHLSEFRGQYILLDFWSMGCGPCLQSLPALEHAAEKYKDRLTLISISQDKEPVWKNFVRNMKMTGNQWNELRKGNDGLAARYRVKGIPHYVLIAPDGQIRDTWTGYGGEEHFFNKIESNLK